jgi:CDGSH-type Zn-finger protein
LCRCGASAIKPYCDGSHASAAFSGAKDPNRVPDRRDTYVGEQLTVFDNRGLCQHSGYCTDRLNTVFRAATEPFVAPSGGRMDEIVRAVRDCPSGALSFALAGPEIRPLVDGDGEPAIEVSKDGPYRITGGLPLTDGRGQPEVFNEGASAEHYALCRCGHSQNKPFCSGVHWYVGFADPVVDPDRAPTLFEWAGGLPALTRVTRLFYEKYVPADPLLAPLFATMAADHPQRVAAWLSEVFGGPQAYSGDGDQGQGGYHRMLSRHAGKRLTEDQRARWAATLLACVDEVGLPADPEFRSAFAAYIEWGSRLAVENSQVDARPPASMPMPSWDWGTAGPPGVRVSALAHPPDSDITVTMPGLDEAVSFDRHIKTLFRARDRQSMKFAFDLWSYTDVKAHAAAILDQVAAGTMPCDEAWPPEQVDTFRRWMDLGTPA